MEQNKRELYWRNVLGAFIQSRMTQAEFCASHTQTTRSFYKWRKRLGLNQPRKDNCSMQLQLIPIDMMAGSGPVRQHCG